MRKGQNKNFWSEFFKWFLIWEFIGLIFKGIFYFCKLIWLAFKQLVWLIYIGIKRITPIIREKTSDFYTNLNTTYKPKIAMKVSQFKDSANVFKNKLVGFLDRHKPKRKIKNNTENRSKEDNGNVSKIKIKIKKVKYSFLNFYYDYELLILIGVIVDIIIVIFIIF